MNERPLMNVAELAAYLKISEVTVYRHAKAGKLPGFKIGADWRFNREQVDKYYAARTIKV